MQSLNTIVRRFGPAADAVELIEEPVPEPGPGQVVVRMARCAINPSDLVTISGAYRSRVELPFRPGYEGAGEVTAVGSGVTGLRPGQRVLPIGTPGSWSSYKLTEARWCFPVSGELDDDQAATAYINPVTAWLMLHERAAVRPDMKVLITAGGSQIGRMMVRMLNRIGLRPVITVREDGPPSRFDGLGIELAVVTGSPGFEDHLAELAGARGFDLVLDAVGGEVGEAAAASMATGGRFIHYGLLSGVPLSPETGGADSGFDFEHFVLRRWIHGSRRERIAEVLAAVEPLILDGTAASDIDSRFPLGEIKDALARHDEPGRRGKVLLQPR